jgi:putative transposase
VGATHLCFSTSNSTYVLLKNQGVGRDSVRSARHLFAQSALSYPFIAEQAKEYPVSTLCRVMQVSVSGYYDWLKREPSAHEREDGELAREIHRLFYANRQVYGSPRIQVELRDQGMFCSKERVARLMREMELVAKVRRNKPVGTKRRNGVTSAPHLLNRDFSASAPNAKWVSDTTYVWTAEGWLYVAIILDLFSRLVAGWAMGPNNDEELVRTALEMALVRRSPPAEMLLHSDQGSPYTATGYLARLSSLGIVVSMSRVGDCYDNAAMESFFSTLKGECVERKPFQTRQEARQTIFEYIECFYNRVRRHSTLKYLSPVAYEQQMR